MTRQHFFSHWMPIIALGILLASLLLIFLRYQRRPKIEDISSISASFGDVIELTGHYFGKGSESSSVLLGSRPLNSASIIEWQDSSIKARVPRRDGAVLIKVKNRSGLSNGVVLGDAKRFPQVEYGSWLPGAPFVEYIHPPAGGPGTLVSLHGKGFGNHQGSGKIWLNNKDSSSLFENKEPNLNLYEEAREIKLWTDAEIRFWVPENTSSGNIYIDKGGQFSNPTFFERDVYPGNYTIGNSVRWSLQQKIRIARPGAFSGNSLYLRIPEPVKGIGQKTAVVLDTFGRNSAFRDGTLDIYRLDNLATGKNWDIIRQIIVITSSVKIEIVSDIKNNYDISRPSIAASLESDRWVRPDLTKQIAARVVNNFAGDWKNAQAIYSWVTDFLEPVEEYKNYALSDYIESKQADSFGYSLLFCSLARAAKIPSRPVGGILVAKDGSSRQWWWSEFWLEGLGWVPVDPALGETESDYFGRLDEKHIAFSRGILNSVPLQPYTEFKEPQNFYSLQDIYEEISGNLHSYLSYWPVPEVLSLYQESVDL